MSGATTCTFVTLAGRTRHRPPLGFGAAPIGNILRAYEDSVDRLGRIPDIFLLAGRYTLLNKQAVDTRLPHCAARDFGVAVGGPYNSGILATGPVAGARTPAEAVRNAQLIATDIPPGRWRELRADGLLHPEAPC